MFSLSNHCALLRITSCFQVNRLASIAIALHCLLPLSWVPPLVGQEEKGEE